MAVDEINLPDVVAEVSDIFERYETALVEKDVDVLDATFWNSPLTIRYARHENGYGFEEIHAHRLARPKGVGLKGARRRLVVTTFGRDVATVNLEYHLQGSEEIGRQTQFWIRMPEVGWKVVSAHVSTMPAAAAW